MWRGLEVDITAEDIDSARNRVMTRFWVVRSGWPMVSTASPGCAAVGYTLRTGPG
jgi:hypothetical protein